MPMVMELLANSTWGRTGRARLGDEPPLFMAGEVARRLGTAASKSHFHADGVWHNSRRGTIFATKPAGVGFKGRGVYSSLGTVSVSLASCSCSLATQHCTQSLLLGAKSNSLHNNVSGGQKHVRCACGPMGQATQQYIHYNDVRWGLSLWSCNYTNCLLAVLMLCCVAAC